MTDHLIRYGVVLRDSNLDADNPSNVFDCIAGAGSGGVYTFVERPIEPGTIIGAVESVPDTFDQTIKLYRVEADGPANLLDDQPVIGDTVTSVCPPNDILFQAGMHCIVVADDGHIATISIGLLLTLFPLFAQDWLSQVPGMLQGALGALDIPAQVQAALSAAGVGGGGVRKLAYSAFASPENLAGTSHTISMPDGTSGGLTERTVAPGDVVACITGFRDDVPYGAVAELRVVTELPADGEEPHPWPLAVRQIVQGDLFITTGANPPADNVGLLVIAPYDGVVMAAQANVITRIIDELSARIDADGAAGPLTSTPMESVEWDGTDRFVISADSSNQHIDVFMPDPNDQAIAGHELTVIHRNDGGTGNNVAIAVNDDPAHNIVVPVGHVATIRVAAQQFVLTGWI